MRMKCFLLLVTCLCFTGSWSWSRQVTGKKNSDSTRTTLARVNVNDKNTHTTIAAKTEGSFSITIPDNNNAALMSHFNYNHSLISSDLFFIKQAIPLSFLLFSGRTAKRIFNCKTYCSFQANYF